jgi:hypothetical protein
VQIEVFFRCDEGCVRSKEADADEEGLVAMLFEELNGLGGDHAIGLFFVGAFGGEPAQGGADGFLRRGVGDEFFVGDIATRWVHDELPRGFVVEAVGADAVGDVVVVDFADASGEPAVLAEELRQRDGIRQSLAEMAVEVIDLCGIGSATGEHGGAAGIAERDLIVGAVKPHAAGREAVDMRCAWAIVREIVDGDEENVHRLRR